MKDLEPYFQNYRLSSISPDSKTESIKINGKEYTSGLYASMDRALIGNNPGWAYFNLRGQYGTLSFIIGPADDTENHMGSGWFTVKADGKIIFEEEMSYDDIARQVTLDITGCEMLSFHSEQESGSTAGGFVQIMAYPAGEQPVSENISEAPVDPRLKSLPDVCKLISNIPPYAAGALTDKQIYDGSSDYITFSMGGTKFSEGIILYDKANVLSSNTSAYAVFDLGNEFDYVSFTTGYIGESGALTNDVLRVYADDELVFETPLIATYPNSNYTVPIKRCRKLRFENQGSGSLNVGAFGIADIIVYRGEPVENDLFRHPQPICPDEIDLIDLGAPYIHYVAPMSNHEEQIFHDGSSKKNYFEMPDGQRIYKGFMLQTSVHFSLDHGVLSGTDGAAAGALGGAAVGSAFVAGGAAVGGAVVGSTLAGAAALLMLAAGGEALESSCAAFNTYGEYNSVTFTVSCLKPYIREKDYTETLLIGADHKVVAEIALYESMEPQTVTVPIDGCRQLMFWLANTDNWSGQYIFHDIKLSKQKAALDVPRAARLSQAVITRPAWSEKTIENLWERQPGYGNKEIDGFFTDLSIAYEQLEKLIKLNVPYYEIYTYYLETDAGQVCKAVTLESTRGDNLLRIPYELDGCMSKLEDIISLRSLLADLTIAQASAALSLPSLGLGAFAVGKTLTYGSKVLSECRKLADQLYEEKLSDAKFLESVVSTAIDIDGKSSTETTILCPLQKGEIPPTDQLQLVKHFVIR